MHKILFACSEMAPLVKTGGLADVAAGLPAALNGLHQDARIIMPAYRAALSRVGNFKSVAKLELAGSKTPVQVLEGSLPGSGTTLYLVDAPQYFDRPGSPYAGLDGVEWADNAARFTLFCRAVVALALNQTGLNWQPDVVHCNDWHTGLVPALLSTEPQRPATLFTIHNLAYQGLFPQTSLQSLALPTSLWSSEAMEFYGQFSFMKGGLVFADWLSTVSPTYAREICTPAFGCGLDGLLDFRADRLTGILNGADYTVWDPRQDPLITKNYNVTTLSLKALNKSALQRRFNLPVAHEIPLIAFIGRLVDQKGVDMLFDALPTLLQHKVQLVVLGSGEHRFEKALLEHMEQFPEQVGGHIGYDESLAHSVEAGADMFIMPSRFEPCGLNQMYSMRYGTVPIVRRTGGLADSVIDATWDSMRTSTATGFVFDEATPQALLGAVSRALDLFGHSTKWRILMRHVMMQDFSWQESARAYLNLYQRTRNQKAS